MVHLDAFSWVQRDSYLPQGNQGLKSVTRCKLGYDPVEVDPEDMLNYAREKPDHMASYSVSDAVATYYLYTTYVHNFIFSLSTIIPMASEDVLRKGSGTLCEALLMVEAFRGNIICPNKQNDPLEGFYNGKLVESETYIGGHVECLEAGIFRADIPSVFSLVPAALQQLIDHVDRDIAFAMEIEHGIPRSDAANYDEVKQAIVEKLEMLRDCPNREEHPVIYHLDVGAMYPNIILTNRLQPSSIVSTADCASCKYNQVSLPLFSRLCHFDRLIVSVLKQLQATDDVDMERRVLSCWLERVQCCEEAAISGASCWYERRRGEGLLSVVTSHRLFD